MSKLIEYSVGAVAALFIVAWQGAVLGASLDGPAGQSVSVSVPQLDRAALSAYHREHGTHVARKG